MTAVSCAPSLSSSSPSPSSSAAAAAAHLLRCHVSSFGRGLERTRKTEVTQVTEGKRDCCVIDFNGIEV